MLILAASQGVVLISVVVLLEVGFEPLTELEVVEIASLHELGYIDMALDAVLIEGLLQHLVVVDELVLVLGTPLNSAECEGSRVERVQNGAVDGPSRALLDLGQLQLHTHTG